MSFRAYMIVSAANGRRIETVEGTAKRLVKESEEGSLYRPIEIPSNKSELVHYINDLLTGMARTAEPAAPDIDTLMDDAPRSDIADMDPGQLAPVLEAAVERLGELGLPARDAIRDRHLAFGKESSPAFSRGANLLAVLALAEIAASRPVEHRAWKCT